MKTSRGKTSAHAHSAWLNADVSEVDSVTGDGSDEKPIHLYVRELFNNL